MTAAPSLHHFELSSEIVAKTLRINKHTMQGMVVAGGV